MIRFEYTFDDPLQDIGGVLTKANFNITIDGHNIIGDHSKGLRISIFDYLEGFLALITNEGGWDEMSDPYNVLTTIEWQKYHQSQRWP